MSYRTEINNFQVFGNNEYYQEWIDFLKSENIEIDEEGSYDGYIDNLQGMFNTIDKITRRLINERHDEIVNVKRNNKWGGKPYPHRELTDLSDPLWLNDETPILMWNKQMIENAYCFLPYQVFEAVKDIIEISEEVYKDGTITWDMCSYKLKDGKKIHVHAR